jgi:hypothetical protein
MKLEERLMRCCNVAIGGDNCRDGFRCNNCFDKLEALREITRMRGVLQQIAEIEHEDIPKPTSPNEGYTWTVLAIAVGLAENALRDEK